MWIALARQVESIGGLDGADELVIVVAQRGGQHLKTSRLVINHQDSWLGGNGAHPVQFRFND